MPADVFVGYSNRDLATADAVVAALEGSGVTCWIAPRDVVPGSSWAESISDAIEQASLMVVILSVDSLGSRPVLAEMEAANRSGTTLLPIRIDGTAIPGAVRYLLSGAAPGLDLAPLPRPEDTRRLVSRVLSELDGPAPPGTVEFYPEGLLHKFGFGDGDMLFDLIEEHRLDVHYQDLLVAVVERLVVPRLDQDVETYTICATLHNPIRARTIDGAEASLGDILTPEIIRIPVADIIEIARTLPRREDEE